MTPSDEARALLLWEARLSMLWTVGPRVYRPLVRSSRAAPVDVGLGSSRRVARDTAGGGEHSRPRDAIRRQSGSVFGTEFWDWAATRSPGRKREFRI